jgi:hypothetical protein
MSGPYRVHSHSSLRRRPDAATWLAARDVSQRAEPYVRPLGRAAPAFIAEEARRLSNWQVMCRLSIKYAPSTPLTSDVPPQHLMCPVHSADERRQAILQAACPSAPVAGSTTVPWHTLYSSSFIRDQGGFCCTPMLRRSRISWRKEIALATSISCSK